MPVSSPTHWCPGNPSAWIVSVPAPLDLESLASRLAADAPELIWLDSARQHAQSGRYSVLAWDPWLRFESRDGASRLQTSDGPRDLHGNPLDLLRSVLAAYAPLVGESVPPVGIGLIGVVGYEAGRWIERLPRPKPAPLAVPELLLFGMRLAVVVDHAAGMSWCVSVADPHVSDARAADDARRRLDELLASIGSAIASDASADDAVEPADMQSLTSQAEFERMVGAAKELINAGDIFQANLSQAFVGCYHGSTWSLYRTLRRINPSPFACFLSTPTISMASCSPERLVRMRDGVVSTRPIAGTRPRGRRPDDDLLESLELILSDKERAEHIMLVDLERNDLGRVCRAGSVLVDELMTLEEYSHVIHLVSNVEGRLRDGADAVDVLRAVFPGGTITGCPKVRAMEVISDLEPVGRGWYTGSCGMFGFDGTMDLNILIRTIVRRGEDVAFHVGAGIVADSQPEREYRETLAKAGALLAALGAPTTPSTTVTGHMSAETR